LENFVSFATVRVTMPVYLPFNVGQRANHQFARMPQARRQTERGDVDPRGGGARQSRGRRETRGEDVGRPVRGKNRNRVGQIDTLHRRQQARYKRPREKRRPV